MIEVLGRNVGCPRCTTLKSVLEREGVDYVFIEANPSDKRASELMEDIFSRGIRDIPSVWIDGKYIGSGSLDIKDIVKE